MEGFDAKTVPTAPMIAPTVEDVEAGASEAEYEPEAKTLSNPLPPTSDSTANIGATQTTLIKAASQHYPVWLQQRRAAHRNDDSWKTF